MPCTYHTYTYDMKCYLPLLVPSCPWARGTLYHHYSYYTRMLLMCLRCLQQSSSTYSSSTRYQVYRKPNETGRAKHTATQLMYDVPAAWYEQRTTRRAGYSSSRTIQIDEITIHTVCAKCQCQPNIHARCNPGEDASRGCSPIRITASFVPMAQRVPPTFAAARLLDSSGPSCSITSTAAPDAPPLPCCPLPSSRNSLCFRSSSSSSSRLFCTTNNGLLASYSACFAATTTAVRVVSSPKYVLCVSVAPESLLLVGGSPSASRRFHDSTVGTDLCAMAFCP